MLPAADEAYLQGKGYSHDVSIEAAIIDYVRNVLPGKPDEATVLGVDTIEMPVVAMFPDVKQSGR